jgi:glycosyltransferase involved in cell wall biosynthesis
MDNLITINITTHNEGLILYRTLRSIISQIDYCSNRLDDIAFEINIAMDCPDSETISCVELMTRTFNSYNIKVFRIEEADISASRNMLISKSSGKYIAFFDGDDFFSLNYIYNCYIKAEKNSTPSVYCTESCITFESSNSFWKKSPENTKYSESGTLLLENPFQGQLFVHSDIYKKIKYDSVSKGSGYGTEDMHWNTKVIASGYKFLLVPDTIYFYRVKKENSLLKEHGADGCILRPTPLFEPNNFLKFFEKAPLPSRINGLETIVSNNIIRNLYNRKVPVVIKNYISSIMEINKYLLSNTNIYFKKKIKKVDLYEYFNLSPKEEFYKKFKYSFKDKKSYDIFWDNWSELNIYEPMINQNLETIKNVSSYDIFKKEQFIVSEEYYAFCKYVVDNKIKFKHIIFIPWLIQGGSDKFVKLLADNLSKEGGALLISTDMANRVDVSMLPDGVFYYNFDGVYNNPHNSRDHIDKFSLRLIQNFNVSTLSIINSRYANELIIKYGKQISDSVKIFSYRWSIEKNYNNNYRESPDDLYQKTYKNLAAIVTDNHKTLEDIRLIMNPDEKRVRVLNMPINKHPHYNYKFTEAKKRILIAGRIAKWDKMIETSIEVASNLASSGIIFDFYGTLDDYYNYNQKFLGLIDNFPNISYKGSYKKFEDINISLYDALLMISRSEGMPNVVLESIGANLFIISTRVGGVPWVVESGVNGYLVDDPSDVSQYVNAIKKFYKNRNKDSFKRQTEFNQKIISDRTEENFKKCVKKVYTI